MVIRAYQPFDAVPLAALFYQTVHTVNRRDYTEKQLDAWAPKDIDLGAWDPLSPTPPSPRGLSLKKEDIGSSGPSRWNAGGFF